jgi:hypothetical protein
MKKFYLIMLLAYCVQHTSAQSANQNLSNLTSPTAVNVDLLPGTGNSLNLGNATNSWKNIYVGGSVYLGGARFIAYKTGIGGGNTALGSATLNANTIGTFNTATGFKALFSNTTGKLNTATGADALYTNTIGAFNTANGASALYSNTTGQQNIANGNDALYANSTGSYNIANGNEALFSNSTGNFNIANGSSALQHNTTGSANTAIGDNAMLDNTNGYSNVAVGNHALLFNTTGHNLVAVGDSALYNQSVNGSTYYFNTAVGSKTLFSNTTGYDNTASGYEALYSNNTGNSNTASGMGALYSNSTGILNTANGAGALSSNTTGINNSALGTYALANNTTGSSNTALGSSAGPNGQGIAFNNTTAIGYLTLATASNQVRVGNGSVTSIGGQVGWSTLSDGRVKKNIKQNVPGLEFINKLTPITYNLDLDAADKIIQPPQPKDKDGRIIQPAREDLDARKAKEQIIYTGFVAQDVEKAAKGLNYDFSGVDAAKNNNDLYSLRYSDFVVPLVKAVQELSKMNDDKDSIINNLETRLARIESLINVQQLTVNGQQSAVISPASLQQNIPNPFTSSTTIGYSLPGKFSSAQIIITDKNGRQLKQINISSEGKGTITVDASTLASGAYSYSLYVEGKLIGTKQMILAK